jgi:TonB family protein
VTHSVSSRRRSNRHRAAVLVIAFVSVVGHAAVIAVVNIRSTSMSDLLAMKLVDKECVGPECEKEWIVSCESDAALTSSARLSMCASPFRTGGAGGACARDALKQLEIDLVRCRANPEEVAVELVDVDKLDVTPRPLMPDVAPVPDIVAAQLIDKEVAEKLEEAQKPLSKPDPSGQVIEITRPETEKIPDKARYLSEFDSSVEKQVVARGSTEKMVERPAARDLPTGKTSEERPDPEETRELTKTATEGPGKGTGEAPSKLSMRGPGEADDAPPADPSKPGERGGEEVATVDGIAARQGEGGRPGHAIQTQQPGGTAEEAGGGGAPPKTPNLRPSDDLLERAVGGGSVDHLDDAEEGDFTALNSRKWKYATFFNRMKRQVAQNWHPDVVYLRRDPTGNIYGTRDRLTVLQVSLKPNGSVAKIYVAKQSGVDFLDDEAVRAFRESQPFPNPPAGLVDARSNLITFSFGFHFGIGGDRGRWKVFRYQ